jgi:hypothetical protein
MIIQKWLNMIHTYFHIGADLILPPSGEYIITTKFEVKVQETTHKLSKMRANITGSSLQGKQVIFWS